MTTGTALITGAGRPLGIGCATAGQLAEQGFHVILTARDEHRAQERAAELCRAGHTASALRLDLSDPAGIDDAAARVAGRTDRLDVLVNNASSWPDSHVLSPLDADLTETRTAFEVDVLGPWRLIQALLPLLRQAPAARIVNVSSEAALQIGVHRADGFLRAPGYSLAKYTMTVLTSLLAPALADTSILINSVDPGETASHPERGDEDTARPSAESARGVVWAATLPAGGPTGGLFKDGRPVASAAP
ncbi:SDR family NAD(P)-dependent oxidoreductase [Pseudonocardia spinosispora]|uniref:SDR family NAD(P)-dependent oxidoreductase n=1 Tax=Pseudonocardia spinosispora TaxID=103441 RepID=UPI0003F6C7B7|nr:SDR family NAD(P)-dependent oxidoreductase [Pseudonocardia spinosispora]